MSFKVLHPKFLHDLEQDAKTQARFHQWMGYFWLSTMVLSPLVFPPTELSSFVQLLILEVSLYANFATEFGALTAAQASMKADRAAQPVLGYALSMNGGIYLELDAYELGQIIALLPDVAWNRMDDELRKKLRDAKQKVADARKKPEELSTEIVDKLLISLHAEG